MRTFNMVKKHFETSKKKKKKKKKNQKSKANIYWKYFGYCLFHALHFYTHLKNSQNKEYIRSLSNRGFFKDNLKVYLNLHYYCNN